MKKNDFVERLDAYIAARPDLTPSRLSLDAGLDNSAENRGLQARLIALGEQCTELNAANGLLIDRLAEHTRSALRVLRQQDGDPRLYSGTGGADSTRDSQSLGKA